MSNSSSSNINTAIRTRRSNRKYRHRNEFSYLINHPTVNNFFVYFKYFFFKSSFGHLALVLMFIGLFYVFFFCYIQWPIICQWLHNSTATEINEI